MIRTAMGIELDYQALEQILQKSLNANASSVSPLQVRCFEKQESLVIIVQHTEDVISHPRRIFRLIRSNLQEQQILGEVLMYLVVDGKSEPYFSNQIVPASQANSASELNTYSTDNLDDTLTSPVIENNQRSFSFTIISLMAGIACFSITVLIYFFTRPCVLDRCLLIPQAKKIVNESLSSLSENSNYMTIVAIDKQLTEAINNLNTIPPWSQYYSEAGQLVSDYQPELTQIKDLLVTVQMAEKAKAITQKAPLAEKKWQEVINLWQQSINTFNTWQKNTQDNRKIFLNKKLEEYQNNLAIAEEKIKQERAAIKYLLSAQDAAKLGESRQMLANSLTNLQLVEATWRTAIERLEKIPIETTAYSQKQELLDNYVSKFLAAQQRRKQEELAIKLYNQAIRQAELAKNSQANDQWSTAVSYWRNAFVSIQHVPKQTFQYQKAINQIKTLEEALNKAQANLQIALLKQQAKNDLGHTCVNSSKICDYSVSNNLIKVFLTKDYLNQIRQLSNQVQANNNNVVNHISQVEKNLKYISSKYSIPLEVYHPAGNLIIRYEPKSIINDQ